jgi:hypothetical protein
MGVFEEIAVMVNQGILELEIVRRLYAYRMIFIVANPDIRHQKLLSSEGIFWQDFLELCAKLKIEVATHREYMNIRLTPK